MTLDAGPARVRRAAVPPAGHRAHRAAGRRRRDHAGARPGGPGDRARPLGAHVRGGPRRARPGQRADQGRAESAPRARRGHRVGRARCRRRRSSSRLPGAREPFRISGWSAAPTVNAPIATSGRPSRATASYSSAAWPARSASRSGTGCVLTRARAATQELDVVGHRDPAQPVAIPALQPRGRLGAAGRPWSGCSPTRHLALGRGTAPARPRRGRGRRRRDPGRRHPGHRRGADLAGAARRRAQGRGRRSSSSSRCTP